MEQSDKIEESIKLQDSRNQQVSNVVNHAVTGLSELERSFKDMNHQMQNKIDRALEQGPLQEANSMDGLTAAEYNVGENGPEELKAQINS